MNIKWPPEETVKYKAENPNRENGLVINAEPGGNPNKARRAEDRQSGEGR